MNIQNPIECGPNSGSGLSSAYNIEIDVTPKENAPTWAPLRTGITDFSHSTNDRLEKLYYIEGNGWAYTEVIGAQYIIKVNGDRVSGDLAQDFVFKNAMKIGCDRKTNCRITDPGGNIAQSVSSIANINLPSGKAGEKTSFSFEIHFSGEPHYIPASGV